MGEDRQGFLTQECQDSECCPIQVASDAFLEEYPEPFDHEHYLYHVRLLWVGVIRRAIRDWVLNRNSKKLARRAVARDAYVWLFVEGPDHPDWRERGEDGVIMSFIGLCKAMDLDPATLREGIQLLDEASMKSRMSETRKTPSESDVGLDAMPLVCSGLFIDDDEFPSDTSDYSDYVED